MPEPTLVIAAAALVGLVGWALPRLGLRRASRRMA